MAFQSGGDARGGGLGPMSGIVAVAIGLIVVVTALMFGPVIGSGIEKSTPAANYGQEVCAIGDGYYAGLSGYCGVCTDCGVNVTQFSQWNTSHNTDVGNLPTDVWSNNMTLIGLLITVVIISLALAYLIRL